MFYFFIYIFAIRLAGGYCNGVILQCQKIWNRKYNEGNNR